MPPLSEELGGGYWGKHTATIDWCETNYEVTEYIAEFWNTITNLVIMIPPLYGMIDAYRQGFEKRFIVCYGGLFVIGIGSWLFHMTLIYEMQLLDEIPMVLGSAIFTYCLAQLRKPKGANNVLLIIFLLTYCIVFLIVYLIIKKPIFMEVMYAILVFAMVIMDVDVAFKQKSSLNFKLLGSGVIIYLMGFILWNLDNHFCGQLRQFRAAHPDIAPLSQLHGWWHMLVGYASYIQLLGLVLNRQRYLGVPCDLVLCPIGIGIKRLDHHGNESAKNGKKFE